MTTEDETVVTLAAVLDDATADRDITKAVSARHSIARKYVMWLRRKNPNATPAEIVRLLERHYASAISTAGAVIAAGAIAADVGIAMIPVAGPAAAGVKSASAQAAKKAGVEATKAATKAAAKQVALGAAKTGAQRAAALLPAGDQQLQFEITAIFALALADIHGMDLDRDQAHALIYGLSNERVSQQQIATMAADVAVTSHGGVVDVSHRISAGRGDWSHWADTLAESLPAGSAQSFVRTIQTGQLDTVREGLTGKQQSAIEYGVGTVVGGVARFVFGRQVIEASRSAFAAPPEAFPNRLALTLKTKAADEADDAEVNRVLASMRESARSTGDWIAGAAGTVGSGVSKGTVAVGTGVATAADKATRHFRSVDLDGDGIPDEARALTVVKGAGNSIAGAAGAVGGKASALFKSRKPRPDADGIGADIEPPEQASSS